MAVARFRARNISVSEVPAPTAAIWACVSDAQTLAALTPLVRGIDVTGGYWTWHLAGIEGLGLHVAPSFTERMTFEHEREIVFTHDPRGRKEHAGVDGRYLLTSLDDDRTRLKVDLTLFVDLPLPRLSAPAVERIMAATMQRTGRKFATNLYERLGLDPATVHITELPV